MSAMYVSQREIQTIFKHTLIRQHGVVLRCNVIRQVVVKNETEKTVQKRQIDLLVHLRKLRLHQHNALALAGLPDLIEVIDTLAPLVNEQWRRLGIRRLNPRREETPLIRLEEEELVQVCVRDLLNGLDVVARDELIVGVEELDTGLLECTLSEK
jgi:hypothetical protein